MLKSGGTRCVSVDEHAPDNVKLAHIVRYDARDADLLFLKQIGLRWVLLRYGDGDPHVDRVRQAQQCFARYGLQIYGAGVAYCIACMRTWLHRAIEES